MFRINAGISEKIPAFLYPNNIEYFEGIIPPFHTEILNHNLCNAFRQFRRSDTQKFQNYIKELLPNVTIEEIKYSDDNEAILVYTDECFQFYDLIYIEEFLNMEDCYEKAIIAEALNSFPNSNEQEFYFYLDHVSEYDEISNDELKIMDCHKKIKEFLSLRSKDFEPVINNPHTEYLLKAIDITQRLIGPHIIRLDANDNSNYSPIYINDAAGDTYDYSYNVHDKFYRESYTYPVFIHSNGTIDKTVLTMERDCKYAKIIFNENLLKWKEMN